MRIRGVYTTMSHIHVTEELVGHSERSDVDHDNHSSYFLTLDSLCACVWDRRHHT